jgi:hypothetical protein
MKLNIVPASTGITWVKLGIQTFFKQPLAMSALFFMYLSMAPLLSLVPVLGLVLALMLVPAATLGLMAATRETTHGKFPMPTLMVSAFRAGKQRLRAMLVLGLLYAVSCVAITMLAPVLSGFSPEAAAAAAGTGPAAAQALFMSPAFQKNMLLVLAMYLPVSLVFWHAPALVHWHGVSPVKSLFFSAVACVRNAGAMFLYGVGWFIVFLAVTLLAAAVGALAGNAQLAAALMLPFFLMVASMFFTSLYFTFRDSFSPAEATDITP